MEAERGSSSGDDSDTASSDGCLSPLADMVRSLAVDGMRSMRTRETREGQTFSREEVRETLKEGQRALRAVRRAVSGTLLLAGGVLIVAGVMWNVFVEGEFRDAISSGEKLGSGLCMVAVATAKTHDVLVYNTFWAMGHCSFKFACVLLNAAPLRNDLFLSRVIAAATAMAQLPLYVAHMVRKVRFWGEYDNVPESVWAISMASNGLVFFCCLLLATTRRGSYDVQLGVWHSFQVYFSVWIVLDISSLLFSLGDADQFVQQIECSVPFFCVHTLLLSLSLWPGWRSRIHACLGSTVGHAATRSAASVAGMLGDSSPDEVIHKSGKRFRCVFPEQLRFEDMQAKDPDPSLYELSAPTDLGFCDAFVSHSWSDDATAKWIALQEWCATFREQHGREPSLWIDKFCINQADIDTDLQCLPVFLCGCRELLVLCGASYFSRLWCILELFTHHHVDLGKHRLSMVMVLRDGRREEDLRDIASTTQTFDVELCECSSKPDKRRMIEIIEAACGSSAVFNEFVREIIPAGSQLRQHRSASFRSEISRRSSSGSSSSSSSDALPPCCIPRKSCHPRHSTG